MKPAVLIVDDEPHIQQAIRRLLHREGYEVHVADSGPAALEILARHEVAVIICDQRMPNMTGAQVLAESVRLRPDAYRITITGYSDLKALEASINAGHVNYFLTKPWNDEHLLKVVQEGVRAYQLVMENRQLAELTRQQKAQLEEWNRQLEQQVQERTRQLHLQNQELLRLRHRLEQSLRDTVAVLAGMLEAYSPNLAIHAKRVAGLGVALGSRLSLTESDLQDLEFAARLHDIGQISALCQRHPARRGSLERAQRELRHPEAGYAILSQVAGFGNVALAVRHQHEHYDGSGQPEGLKAADIPLGSRVIAVADAYDNAVFSPLSPTRVLREEGRRVLLQGRGKRFDPLLVDLLLAHVSESGVETYGDWEVELSPSQVSEGMVLSRPLRSLQGSLLLPAGTRLTPELLERVRNLCEVNPLLASVFVKCTSPSQEPEAGPRPGATADRPPEKAPAPASGPPEPERQRGARPDAHAYFSQRPDSWRGNILIVDDVTMMCNALKRALEPAGYQVAIAKNGREALHLIQQQEFDAVVTDLMMPEMSGEELVSKLRDCRPELPCIILTGNATTQEVLRAGKSPNVVGVLVKPWNHQRLLQTVGAAVTKRCATTGPGTVRGPARGPTGPQG